MDAVPQMINLRRDDLLSIKQVRDEYIPAGYPFIVDLLRSGRLKGKKIGRKWVTCREWVQEYLNTPESEEGT